MFSARPSVCLRHPTASLGVLCCKSTYRTSGNAFFFISPKMSWMFLWGELRCNCWHNVLQGAAWLGRSLEQFLCELPLQSRPCAVRLLQTLFSPAFGSNLNSPWSQLNLQTQPHFIQINVFSSLVSLVAGCKIICLTSSLLSPCHSSC